MFLLIGITSSTLLSYFMIQKETKHIFDSNDTTLMEKANSIDVAIIFGGGVTDTEPLPLLRDRLIQGKELLDKKYVRKLLVSGDNRFLNYNEPTVMKNYLVDELGVDPDLVQEDFAGRSTYETCERAKKIFGIDQALLVSESTHLPRAVYLCRHFGIDSYGVKSDGTASDGLRIGQKWREVLARNKALFNVFLYGENTVLGDPINLNL